MATAELSEERVRRLREIIMDEAVCRIAGGVGNLPTLPATYNALCRATADPATRTADITKIIETDPAISVRLLQLVNSAFFGAAQRTSSIPRAVNIMGTNLLKSLVLSAHMCNALELAPTRSFSMSRYQNYSMGVAKLARTFAGSRGFADEAFTAGIVLGIGQVVFALRSPKEFEQVLERVADTGEMQHRVEKEILGASHAETGAFILSTWGIPFPIVECVAFQFRPGEVGPGNGELLAIVHTANALSGIILCREPEEQLDLKFLERTGLIGELPRWRAVAEEAFQALT